jgi:hypothetical protein
MRALRTHKDIRVDVTVAEPSAGRCGMSDTEFMNEKNQLIFS